MPHILLIDDDDALREILGAYLARLEHRVTSANGGEAGLAALEEADPDVVVLDVAMPGMDGWETLERLRRRSAVPVIMLTAHTEEPEILKGFALGADDYVGKPFSFAQLEARVRAVLARGTRAPAEAPAVIAGGGLRVNLESHRVSRDGETVKLTPTEFKLLVALMEQPGKILSPDQLVRKVWGPQYATESDYVRRYIWYLRQKLEDNPDDPRYIRNERNVGYYFATT
jgi:two-component system KDP operon response regulator KdpE